MPLEDPGMPIPAESTKIHGITDDMVIGKKIIDADIETLLADVSLVIAHNATFDRGIVEARLPIFQEKAWGCSFAQIPWKNEGISSAALEFIAYRLGLIEQRSDMFLSNYNIVKKHYVYL